MTSIQTGFQFNVVLHNSMWYSTIQCGTPQGSLLAPLLFNIVINDLNYIVNESSLRLYADDMNTYQSDICPMILEFILNDDLARIRIWLTQKCRIIW